MRPVGNPRKLYEVVRILITGTFSWLIFFPFGTHSTARSARHRTFCSLRPHYYDVAVFCHLSSFRLPLQAVAPPSTRTASIMSTCCQHGHSGAPARADAPQSPLATASACPVQVLRSDVQTAVRQLLQHHRRDISATLLDQHAALLAHRSP